MIAPYLVISDPLDVGQALAETLKKNGSLQALGLGSNSIRGAGAQEHLADVESKSAFYTSVVRLGEPMRISDFFDLVRLDF